MVPHVAEAGKSFKGAGLYYLHDKKTTTTERVAFTHTENLPTSDAEKALKCMAWTALHQAELKAQAGIKNTGRKLAAPVYAYSLSWHPDETPDQAAMIAAGRASLKALGLENHQAVFVAHRDEPHPHLHIIVNRVHPHSGLAANLRKDQLKLSQWAERYEREHGKIYCEARVENNQKRNQGQFVKHREAAIQAAWTQSDTGKAFAAALAAQGYCLCRGEKRDFVVVDPHGKALNPARQIEGVKVKDLRARLADLDREALPTVEEARARQRRQGEAGGRQAPELGPAFEQARQEPPAPVWDRERYQRDWEEGVIDAALQHAEAKAEQDQQHARLEAWASQQRAAMQNRQHGELIDLDREQDAAFAPQEREIATQYLPAISQAERELQAIEARRRQTGLKRLLYRLRGQAQDSERAEELRQELANIRQRRTEALQAIEGRKREAREALQAKHARERRGEERTIAEALRTGRLPGPVNDNVQTRAPAQRQQHGQVQDHRQDHGHSQGRGRSRGRSP